MPKFLKYILYFFLFIFSFIMFLYWLFPYEILKSRVESSVEEFFKNEMEVSIGDIEPYYFTGVSISKLVLTQRKDGHSYPVIECSKAKIRASFFSLLLGNPDISFYIKSGSGEIEGQAKQGDDVVSLVIELDDFDISAVKWLKSKLSLNLAGQLDGEIDLQINKARSVRSVGKMDILFNNFKIFESELDISGSKIPIPETIISKHRNSRLKVELGKGVATIEEFKFVEGDLQLDLGGKVFLSPVFKNYRLNIKGSFNVSEKLAEAIPFLFIAEKQKQQDGSYPLNITGRLSSPSIKIGTLSIPKF